MVEGVALVWDDLGHPGGGSRGPLDIGAGEAGIAVAVDQRNGRAAGERRRPGFDKA